MDSELEKRLIAIENRLRKLEGSVPPETATKENIVVPRPIKEKKPGNWLGYIAIICFIIAAAFIVKLSIDTGWLTPARQLAIAYLFGLILVVIGLLLLKQDRAYASLLPATGIIIFNLTTFLGSQYYDLISFNLGLLIIASIAAVCIILYFRIKHDIYPIISALGAYLGPIVLQLNHTNFTFFSLYYFMIVSIAFAFISIWVRSRLLVVIAAYLAILSNAIVGLQLNDDKLMAIVLPIHFVIFSLGSYFYSRQSGHELGAIEAWSFFPVLLIFYAMEYHFIYNYNPTLAPWLSLAFAAFIIFLYLLSTRLFANKSLPSLQMIIAFVSVILFHSGYLELIPDPIKPWLLVFLFLAAAFIPNLKSNQKFITNPYSFALIFLLAVIAIEYIKLINNLINTNEIQSLIVGFAALASLWFAILRHQERINKEHDGGYIMLATAHVLAITALYRLTTDWGSLAVSASWLLYAIVVIGLAFVYKNNVMARSAVFVLTFSAAKALLFDAASAPTGVRIFCLILTGIVLYWAGFLFRRIADWQ